MRRSKTHRNFPWSPGNALFERSSYYPLWATITDPEGSGVPPCGPSQRAPMVFWDLGMKIFNWWAWPSLSDSWMSSPCSEKCQPRSWLLLLSTHEAAWLSLGCAPYTSSLRRPSHPAHAFTSLDWGIQNVLHDTVTAFLHLPALKASRPSWKPTLPPREVRHETSPVLLLPRLLLSGGTLRVSAATSSPFWNFGESIFSCLSRL